MTLHTLLKGINICKNFYSYERTFYKKKAYEIQGSYNASITVTEGKSESGKWCYFFNIKVKYKKGEVWVSGGIREPFKEYENAYVIGYEKSKIVELYENGNIHNGLQRLYGYMGLWEINDCYRWQELIRTCISDYVREKTEEQVALEKEYKILKEIINTAKDSPAPQIAVDVHNNNLCLLRQKYRKKFGQDFE